MFYARDVTIQLRVLKSRMFLIAASAVEAYLPDSVDFASLCFSEPIRSPTVASQVKVTYVSEMTAQRNRRVPNRCRAL